MLGSISPWQLLIILLIVVIIFGTRYLRPHIRGLKRELQNQSPVFSAETTERREAEFVRERTSTRWPLWTLLIAIIALGAVVSWLLLDG